MSKNVLISIRPKWVEQIVNGKKTIEIRKTRPKIETPFKCYIYCTNGNGTLNDTLMSSDRRFVLNQKVIGEFICDKVLEWNYLPDHIEENGYEYYIECKDGYATCLTYDEIENYGKGKTLYGWHISGLKIYDKPKELSEFTPVCEYKGERCDNCKFYVEQFGGCCRTLSRPPQSWCYVEEL